MEIFKFNIIPTEEFIKRESFRNTINNCDLCNAPLEFNDRQLANHADLQEQTKCPVVAKEPSPTPHRVH